jgi:hypothetical protein
MAGAAIGYMKGAEWGAVTAARGPNVTGDERISGACWGVVGDAAGGVCAGAAVGVPVGVVGGLSGAALTAEVAIGTAGAMQCTF